MQSWKHDPVKHRLITHRSIYSTARLIDAPTAEPDALRRMIAAHHVQHAIEVGIPLIDDKSISSSFVSAVLNALDTSSSFFYLVTAPLSLLISAPFLNTIRASAQITLLSLTRIDRHNHIALFPNGLLLIRCDADTYEQLGLVGKRVGSEADERYEIHIDTAVKSWAPGRKLYDRAQLALTATRIGNTQVICHAVSPASGHSLDITFPADNSVRVRRVQCNQRDVTRILSEFPDAPRLYNAKGSESDVDELLSAMLEWIGLQMIDSDEPIITDSLDTCALTEATDSRLPYDTDHANDSSMIPSSYQLHRRCWSGIYHPSSVQRVVDAAILCVESGQVPWQYIYVHGWDDISLSFSQSQHSVDDSGVGCNDYCIVILPQRRFILYQIICADDTTT